MRSPPPRGSGVRTSAQRAGDAAEDAVAAALAAAGWTILARHVRVGRLELDLVAVDPGRAAPVDRTPGRAAGRTGGWFGGTSPAVVVVEVRWRRSREFGLPEETVDRRKLGRLRRAAAVLAAGGSLPGGVRLPLLPLRIDLVAAEPGSAGRIRVRHHVGVGEVGREGALW